MCACAGRFVRGSGTSPSVGSPSAQPCAFLSFFSFFSFSFTSFRAFFHSFDFFSFLIYFLWCAREKFERERENVCVRERERERGRVAIAIVRPSISPSLLLMLHIVSSGPAKPRRALCCKTPGKIRCLSQSQPSTARSPGQQHVRDISGLISFVRVRRRPGDPS